MVLAGALTALGCSVAEVDPSPPLSHRWAVIIIIIFLIIISVLIDVTLQNDRVIRCQAHPSSTIRRTVFKRPRCPPSPLEVPCSKETGEFLKLEVSYFSKKNICTIDVSDRNIVRHNSRPDLTYRAPSPAGSFYQVSCTPTVL